MSALASADGELRLALLAVLRRALETVSRLAEHLEVTGTALARGDSAHVETYLGHEMALLKQLNDTFGEQHALLLQQGLTADRQGLEAAVARCHDAELEALWRTLRQALEDCRERNRGNARLAKQASLNARSALRVLRGEDAETAAYGPRGDVQTSAGGGHSIGRA